MFVPNLIFVARLESICPADDANDMISAYSKSFNILLLLDFSLKCLKQSRTKRLFPVNPNYNGNIRSSEQFEVNFAKTSRYQNSAIPFCQKLLNNNFKKM